ncbi:MAG: hypothetical protein EXX96DRAFT_561080 [Benjaminiella poitrasii]|nr:MAG: hypothetical protein EXX96DRAFT_561080 [Benjaminiella poitrasii]
MIVTFFFLYLITKFSIFSVETYIHIHKLHIVKRCVRMSIHLYSCIYVCMHFFVLVFFYYNYY